MRTNRRDDSSLELLLDTITNTFGGILFLAILVALLARTTSPGNVQAAANCEPLTALEATQLSVKIKELEASIAAIRRRASLPSHASSSVEKLPLGALDEATRRLEAAMHERSESLQKTARLQQEAEDARARVAVVEEQCEAVEKQLADKLARRDAARAEAAELSRAALQLDRPPGAAVIEQTVGLPRIRPTDKDEVGVYVRFGRLYMMHHWDRGHRLGPNTEQFVVISGSPQIAIPKPTAGLLIDAASIDRDVVHQFGGFAPQRYYVTCVVFEDSFDVFQILKAALVRKGFEYRLIPRRPGQPVYDTGGSGEAQ